MFNDNMQVKLKLNARADSLVDLLYKTDDVITAAATSIAKYICT